MYNGFKKRRAEMLKKIIFFDLEMLCDKRKLEYHEKQTIRIGAVKLDVMTGAIDRFDEYVKPKGEYVISEFCTSLTGIMQNEVDNASYFETVMSSFICWIGDLEGTVFYTWGEDDMPRLLADATLNELSLPGLQFMEKASVNFQTIFTNEVSFEQFSIENALRFCQMEFEGEKHRPCDDALNTLRLYQYYVENRMRNQIRYLERICFNDKGLKEFKEWHEQIEKKQYNMDELELKELSHLIECAWQLDVQNYLKNVKPIVKVPHMRKVCNLTKTLIKKYQKVLSKDITQHCDFDKRLEILGKIKKISFQIYIGTVQNHKEDIDHFMKEIQTQMDLFYKMA